MSTRQFHAILSMVFYTHREKVITFLIDFLRLDVGEAFSGGGSSTGLSFLLFENFFRLHLSAASAPKFKCICRWWCSFLWLLLLFDWGLWTLLLFRCSVGWCDDDDCWWCLCSTSGLSRLGFESVGDSVTASSEFGLLLWLADSFRLFGELQTESSERERPIKRDTLPDLAASIRVPRRKNCLLESFSEENEKQLIKSDLKRKRVAERDSCTIVIELKTI